MKTNIHRSEDRGTANHGWLKAKFSFSFAQYYNPDRIHFGALRVLNNDIIEGGGGFGTHPHDNMEITTIPLSGGIAHKDSTGHEEIVGPNEVQIMSAGTGVYHSEYNASQDEPAELFQVWVIPDKRGHTPRYSQKKFDPELRNNKIHTFVSPDKEGDNLWLNQDVYFSWIDLDEGKETEYKVNTPGNGVFIMNVEGEINLAGESLYKRDSMEITDTDSVKFSAAKKSFVLLIEVPMYKLN